MFSAYLEDFRDIKIIINSLIFRVIYSIYINKFNWKNKHYVKYKKPRDNIYKCQQIPEIACLHLVTQVKH
jgi:hypothetical protein